MNLSLPEGNGLLIDLEATCCQNGEFSRNHMEIIEIGAVAVNPNHETISEYGTFIRPVRNPKLTEFCTQLTTINQQDVNNALPYPRIAAQFAVWAAEQEIQWWGSWGNYDRNQLTQDTQYHRVPDPLPQPHINLKEYFSEVQGIRKRLGLQQAVKRCGLTFEGTAHRGIDDARNIARVLPWVAGTLKLSN